MDKVFQKTRELGEALLASEAYTAHEGRRGQGDAQRAGG